jgi:nucleoside-diphosphate-sugar epimerase
MKKILVTGSTGQIGSELVVSLRSRFGDENIVTLHSRRGHGPEGRNAEIVDVTDINALGKVFRKNAVGTVYHLAGLLSATGEKDPSRAWSINLTGLKNILDLSVALKVEKVFWPSSIAAFGPDTQKKMAPQNAATYPTTMYGVTKVAGELLCNYYFIRYGLDIRSVRYPGLISYKTEPGGGTTDYATAIFYDALQKKRYTCFVRPTTVLPMMYMDDAIRATVEIMDADADRIKVRTSYNLAGLSFSAEELAAAIEKRIPGFECTYTPDFRQQIADSWPESIDDSRAKADWGWSPKYDLDALVDTMLAKLSKKLEPILKIAFEPRRGIS